MAGNSSSAKRPYEDNDIADYRAVKRQCRDYTGTISVLVGPKEKVFIVHKDALCAKSKFFKAACCGPWKENRESTVHLPEVSPKVFQKYVDWAYGDILVAEATTNANMNMAVKLYLLGDQFDDVKLRNQTIKALTSHATLDKKSPNAADIEAIWAGTTTKSPLRKWVVDELIMRRNRDRFQQDIANYPAEFVQEIACKLLKQKAITNSKEFQAKMLEYLEAEDDA